MNKSVKPTGWNFRRVKNTSKELKTNDKGSFTRTLTVHQIQFLSATAQGGKNGKGLKLEKIASPHPPPPPKKR